MDTKICELTIKSQSGDCKSTEALITQFKPLIKKYANKLNYEDSYSDVLLCFLNGIMSLSSTALLTSQDNGLTAYFKKIVIHSYIYLSKKKSAKRYGSLYRRFRKCIFAAYL